MNNNRKWTKFDWVVLILSLMLWFSLYHDIGIRPYIETIIFLFLVLVVIVAITYIQRRKQK